MQYWRDTETSKLFAQANSALYNLHQHLEKQEESWRDVYAMRVTLGNKEREVSLRQGYKDGIKHE